MISNVLDLEHQGYLRLYHQARRHHSGNQEGRRIQRNIVKSNGRAKGKSFAMPEPNRAIIEYRWREVHNDDLANYVAGMQLEIPVQLIKYYTAVCRLTFPTACACALSALEAFRKRRMVFTHLHDQCRLS